MSSRPGNWRWWWRTSTAANPLEHEIGLYYRLDWPATLDRDDLCGGEPGHMFRWAPAAGLGSLRFEPARLVPVLQNPSGTLRHVVL
jgi:hypothetical protein